MALELIDVEPPPVEPPSKPPPKPVAGGYPQAIVLVACAAAIAALAFTDKLDTVSVLAILAIAGAAGAVLPGTRKGGAGGSAVMIVAGTASWLSLLASRIGLRL